MRTRCKWGLLRVAVWLKRALPCTLTERLCNGYLSTSLRQTWTSPW